MHAAVPREVVGAVGWDRANSAHASWAAMSPPEVARNCHHSRCRTAATTTASSSTGGTERTGPVTSSGGRWTRSSVSSPTSGGASRRPVDGQPGQADGDDGDRDPGDVVDDEVHAGSRSSRRSPARGRRPDSGGEDPPTQVEGDEEDRAREGRVQARERRDARERVRCRRVGDQVGRSTRYSACDDETPVGRSCANSAGAEANGPRLGIRWYEPTPRIQTHAPASSIT